MPKVRYALFVAAVFTMAVTGCKKDETTGPGGGGGPSTINGRVLSQRRAPVPNVPVYIIGKAPVNTDADGRFSIPNVTPPYTIAVVNNADLQVYVFTGVTRTDPTLTYIGFGFDTTRTSQYAGTLHGGSYPQPPNHTTAITLESPVATPIAVAADSAFSVNLQWFGQPSLSGTIHAFQWQTTGGLPSAYTGYGTAPNVTITNGGSVSGASINISRPGDTTASGTITLPGGYTQTGRQVGLRAGQTAAFAVAADPSAAPSFSYTMPRSFLGFFISIAAGGAGSQVSYYKYLQPGSSNAVTVPAGIQLTLPPNATTNVDTGTVFSWTPFTGTVYLAIFQGAAPTSPDYYILTGGTSASIPNFGSIGFGLPTSAGYSWEVYAFTPVAGVDGGTTPAGYLFGIGTVPGTDGGYSRAQTRSFTTRP
jgi:hypothetical protein